MTSRKGAKPTPEQQLASAIERAQQNHLKVVAEGHRLDNGAAIYFVPSASDTSLWHRVTLVGKRLSCDCHAAQFGLYCMHRAAVYLHLKARAAQQQRRAA